ncbi:MAG: LytTR family DNA-binding domain-containing protein [Oscillospiraceae bacterium]|nr:LytTR family DNA-binding domain-containing protein [Oscillospiraceae bacterium]
MRIAICDDSADCTSNLTTLLMQHPQDPQEIEAYSSAEALLRAYKNGVRYDLIFMDIQMGELDGYSAAEYLIEHYKSARPLIVFVSVTADYVFAGYDIGALGYLKKPVDKNLLYKKLDQAFEEISINKIFIRIEGNGLTIPISEILFIESSNNHIVINTVSDQHIARMTFDEICSVLPETKFIQTHRSFIVNMEHVRRHDDKHILFADARIAHLSRSRRKAVIQALSKYFRR